MVDLKERLGSALKVLRERRSITQIELAERCALSRGAIGQFGRILAVLEADFSDPQRQLDHRPDAPAEPAQYLVEIGGVRLGGDEVDRLVRRSLGRAPHASAPPPSPTAVRVGDD